MITGNFLLLAISLAPSNVSVHISYRPPQYFLALIACHLAGSLVASVAKRYTLRPGAYIFAWCALANGVFVQMYLESHGLFGLTTWGGALDKATGRTPPTLHLFSELDPSTPLLQIATPGIGGNCSGSLMHLDMAFDAASNVVHVLAAGLNGHENVGSSAGVLYLWDLVGLG